MNCSEFGTHGRLMPDTLFYILISVSLALPNLVFSGLSWFDTLHLMKWVFAMAPIALISIAAGVNLAIHGPERTSFKIDTFTLIWLMMLGYISIQPILVNILSWSTYEKEWFFFATLIAAYLLCFNCFKDSGWHKAVLWFANINAAVNVVFAELLIRGMNGAFPFIMNVPGNYIGNTGQQEMFGLWMAMAVMNGIYLNAACDLPKRRTWKELVPKGANLILLALNAWGMWNSTTRAGILSLAAGTIIIYLIFSRNCDVKRFKRVGHGVLIVLLMLAMNIGMSYFGFGRAYSLINKTMDMVANTGTFGARRGIWRTSWAVCMEYPVKGVGIGQYKWHYLEGQRLAIEGHPDMKWQYTYWAHNEYLQWFAEFGLPGLIIIFAAGLWWLWSFARAMTCKKMLSLEAAWGCAMLFLIFFDAIFSRPFHRIEDALWIPLAFALANRELLPHSFKWSGIKHPFIYRIFGSFIASVAAAGLIFLGTGLIGDKYLMRARDTDDSSLRSFNIHQALRMPMTKDEAQEQYAYHLLDVAKTTDDPQDWKIAVSSLYSAFNTRPQASLLLELIRSAQRSGNREILYLLVPYLPPGSYRGSPKKGASAP